MKKYTFMWEKYLLVNNGPEESLLPVPENYECGRVCRYGDGFVYRVYKNWVETEPDEFPFRGYLYFCSASKQELYKTAVYDQIKIHMTDFEHGCPYATGFEFLQGDEWTHVCCDGEVWCDEDMEKLPITLYKKVQDNGEETKVCNMCGKLFELWDKQENFCLDHQIGFGSTYDLHRIRLNLCCQCFDKVIDWMLPQCMHNPMS